MYVGLDITVVVGDQGDSGRSGGGRALPSVALGVPETAIVSAIVIDRFLGVYLPAFVGWLPMMHVDVGSLVRGEPAGGEGS